MGNDTSKLHPYRLASHDAAQGYHLSTEAGWNQVEHDWEVMIRVGEGIGLVDPSNNLIATSVLLPLRHVVDWIGMVIVDRSWRRRGVGTRLLRLVLELSPTSVLGLDATDQGLSVYERLGFGATEGITRYRRSEPHPQASAKQHEQIRPVSKRMYREQLVHFAPETTEDRQKLLEMLIPEGGAVCAVRDQETKGMASIRIGRTGTQVGPIYAEDADSALAVLRSIAERRTEPLIVDCPDRQVGLKEQLSQLGFEPSRKFTRMFRGGDPTPNPREFATAGPEFG